MKLPPSKRPLSTGEVVFTFASHFNKADRSIRCVITELPESPGHSTLYHLSSDHWLCGGVWRARGEFSTLAQVLSATHGRPAGTLVLAGWGGPQDGGYLVLPHQGYVYCRTYADACRVSEERGAPPNSIVRYDPLGSYTGTSLRD